MQNFIVNVQLSNGLLLISIYITIIYCDDFTICKIRNPQFLFININSLL